MFDRIAHKALFTLPPEMAHHVAMNLLKWRSVFMPLPKSKAEAVRCYGIDFPNPLGLAAGLDKNGDFILPLLKLGFGFVEVGTITPKAQLGNPKPRLFRVEPQHAIINRMGFNNKGVEHLRHNLAKARRVYPDAVIGVNIGKNLTTSVENAANDYVLCLSRVYEYASYITVNISSPNTPGLRELQFGEQLAQLLNQLKQAQADLAKAHQKSVPLLLKIAPDVSEDEVTTIAQAVVDAEFDGVIATNTTIDKSQLEARWHDEAGGLSGRPLTDASTAVVKQLSAALKTIAPDRSVPIIGVGGVDSMHTMDEKIKAGASLVQIYSGFIYHGPKLVLDLANYRTQ